MAHDCSFVGEEWNPMREVDRNGRPNPYQDPNRGTMPNFTTLTEADGGSAFPTCVANDFFGGNRAGFEDLEPQILLQNLDGIDSIMGRSMQIVQVSGTVQTKSCYLIAVDVTPEGYGLIDTNYPLSTTGQTYSSYGTNTVVPVPYNANVYNYQSTAFVHNERNDLANYLDQFLT